jgi:SAM-dependent methyltransferase
MPPMNSETFARMFSAQYADFDEDLPLWRRLAREVGGPILEVGCGAGRVLCALARHGYEVTGIDSNPAMLRRAIRRLSSEPRTRAHVVEQDITTLDLQSRFRLILAPCNILAGMTDEDLALAFSRLHAHLLPGGRFAFEVPFPGEAEASGDPDEPLAAFLEPESGNPVQVFAEQQVDPDGRHAVVTWRYDELRPDGTAQSWTLPTLFHVRPANEYIHLLEDAGFRHAAAFGGYDLGPPRGDDALLIVLATG